MRFVNVLGGIAIAALLTGIVGAAILQHNLTYLIILFCGSCGAFAYALLIFHQLSRRPGVLNAEEDSHPVATEDPAVEAIDVAQSADELEPGRFAGV